MTSSIKMFNSLSHLVGHIKTPLKSGPVFGDKIILKRTIYDNNKYNFLCWKSKSLYNIYLDEYSYLNKIFVLDFNINKDILKIKYLSINNDYNDNTLYNYYYNKHMKTNMLTNDEMLKVKRFIFDYIFGYAINKDINKVIIDIHSNLERYNYELKNEGFIPIINNKCKENPFWIEAEKNIYKNNSIIIKKD